MNKISDFEELGYEKFDSIICSNVLEHIEKDEHALKQCYKLLRNKGKLLIIVPQNPKLYSLQDKALGHFRRYTRNELKQKANDAGFSILKIKNFNGVGIIGWRLNKNAKQTKNNPKLINLFNLIIPVVKKFDDLIISKFTGLSLIIILEKA